MKRAIAHSRCEVGGKVYLPGDDMTITEEQFDFLLKHNAVTEIVLRSVGVFVPPNATIEEVEAVFDKKLGKPDKTNGGGKPK